MRQLLMRQANLLIKHSLRWIRNPRRRSPPATPKPLTTRASTTMSCSDGCPMIQLTFIVSRKMTPSSSNSSKTSLRGITAIADVCHGEEIQRRGLVVWQRRRKRSTNDPRMVRMYGVRESSLWAALDLLAMANVGDGGDTT